MSTKLFACLCCDVSKKDIDEVLPEPLAHRAALISISMALSQTPAYAARPWIRG